MAYQQPIFPEDWPIDNSTRDWVDARVSWILHQFGRDRVTSCEIVLPTADFFPDEFVHYEKDVRALFDQTCGFLQLSPNEIELNLYRESERLDGGSPALGLYQQLDDGFSVWIERSLLQQPLDMAATMAHELCHIHLLGHGRLSADEDDHEPLTDLLTVFLGYGIIRSNSALYECYWRRDGSWVASRSGYLTMPTYGYALALFAILRGELSPAWRKYLRPEVKNALETSLKYLGEHGKPNLDSVMTTIARPTRLQSDTMEVEPELTADTTECPFCGVKLPYRGTCDDCRASIDENKRELELERQREEILRRRYRIVYLGCLVVLVLFILIKLLLEQFGAITWSVDNL